MSFFDKVTKAVGDVVDKGKKDVDQFIRIQKVNNEIGSFEKRIAGLKTQIDETTRQAGLKAIALARAGAITPADLQGFVDQVAGLEQQIAVEEGNITAKKAEIERIRAEDATPGAPAASVPPVPSGAVPSGAAPSSDGPAAPPPIPGVPPLPASPVVAAAPAAGTCTQCGAALTGAFCTECGAKRG